ncbi:MAG: LacI family DNA-binding transcriptional regulator [Chthoniobacteraceae bacterium]
MSVPTEGFIREVAGADSQNRSSTVARANGAVKTVTMADVAHRSGVSQGAISSLLNDRDYGIRVSQKTREKVFNICRDLGYVPNDLRAVVRIYPELGETCLLVSDKIPGGIANPFISRLTAEVMAQIRPRHASIGVILYDETHDYLAGRDLPTPLKHGTASKVLCVGVGNSSICRLVHERGLPAVLLGHTSEVAGTTSVSPDYAEAAQLALGLLVRHRHRRVAIVGGPFGSPEPRLAEMNRAVGEAAHELGLVIGAEDVFAGDLTFEAGDAAMKRMLGREVAPTALLCLSESAAVGAVAAARAHGIRVPEELSIVTFADHAGVIDSCVPLTAVVLPVDELASVAVREADCQIRDGVTADAKKITVGVRLIERGTSGPAGR